MRMRYKLLIIFLILNIAVQLLCKLIFDSYVQGVILLLLEAAFLAAFFILNKLILSSDWFRDLHADPEHERYPDNIWYRNHDERNFELINLGSNSAKYAFDYSDVSVRAMNWSSGTQTLIDDFKLVRNFHSILKKNGTVIITIMPFTSINKLTGFKDAFRFWKVLDHIQTASEYRKKCRLCEHLPIFFGISALKTVVKVILGMDKPQTSMYDTDHNPFTEDQLKEHAANIINSWKNEFSIEDLEQPLTAQNQKGRNIRITVMRELIDFLQERGYNAVYVIPPVSSYLKEYFTDAFLEIYIYSYLKQVDRNIPIIDFMKDKEFSDKELYFNSYYLNKRGSGMFTNKVISELKKIKML